MLIPASTGLAHGAANFPDEYVNTTVSNTRETFSSKTFSSLDLGEGTTKIVVIPHKVTNSQQSGRQLTSATIDGVSATVHRVPNSSSWEQCVIIYATGISATTGDIVLNWGSSVGSGSFDQVISLIVYSSGRSTSFAFTSDWTGSTATVSATGNAANNSDAFIVAGLSISDHTLTLSATGLTVDSLYTAVSNLALVGGSIQNSSSSVTISGSGSDSSTSLGVLTVV